MRNSTGGAGYDNSNSAAPVTARLAVGATSRLPSAFPFYVPTTVMPRVRAAWACRISNVSSVVAEPERSAALR